MRPYSLYCCLPAPHLQLDDIDPLSECFVASDPRRAERKSPPTYLGSFEYSASPFLVPEGDLNGALVDDGKEDFGTTTTRIVRYHEAFFM